MLWSFIFNETPNRKLYNTPAIITWLQKCLHFLPYMLFGAAIKRYSSLLEKVHIMEVSFFKKV